MKTKVIDKAVAQITEPTRTAEDMVTSGTKVLGGIKASPSYQDPNAKEIQAAADAWQTENDNLDAINKQVGQCENELAQARTLQAAAMRRWMGRARGCVSAVNVFCDGSKDLVQSFALEVANRTETPLETVPENVRGVRSKVVGTATVKWNTHANNHGYMVQYATNLADQATFSAPVHWTKGTYELPGQTPGATLYFRVAALDARLPGGQTAYSAWVPVMVSS